MHFDDLGVVEQRTWVDFERNASSLCLDPIYYCFENPDVVQFGSTARRAADGTGDKADAKYRP